MQRSSGQTRALRKRSLVKKSNNGRNRVSTPKMWIQVPVPPPESSVGGRRFSRCSSRAFHRFRLRGSWFFALGRARTSHALGLFSVDQLKCLEGRGVGEIG